MFALLDLSGLSLIDLASVLSGIIKLVGQIIEWIIYNIKTISELLFGGGIVFFIYQKYCEKKKKKKLITKLKFENAHELFIAEMRLACMLSYMVKKDNELPVPYYIELPSINSTLASGLFVHFDSYYIALLFDVSTQVKNIFLFHDQIIRRRRLDEQTKKTHLRELIRRTVRTYNTLRRSFVYSDMKNEFLIERIAMGKTEAQRKIDLKHCDKSELLDSNAVVAAWEKEIRKVLHSK